MPASSSSGAACCRAWPVPSCGSWRTNASPGAAVACSTSAAPWPVTTIVRDAPRPAAASRTCCNKWRPARRCSTFGRAERIRVPLPAAMITTFNTMRLPVSLPSMPAADYRDDARGLGAVLGLRHGPQARLQPGPVARLPLARRLCRVRRRAVAARARRPRRVVRLASAHPAARLRRPAGPGPDRAAGLGHRRADVRLEPRPARPLRHRARARGAGAGGDRADALAAADREHREALRRRRTTSTATTSCSATRRSGRRPRPSARSSAPRTSTAGSTTPSAPSSPARSPNRRGTATSPMPSGCAASRTC